MGLLDNIKNGVSAQGSGKDLGNAAAGALGTIFGNKVNEAAKPAASAVNGKINEIGQAGLNFLEKAKLKTEIGFAVGRLPDNLPLDGPQSKNFTTFVENALNESGYTKVKPDGKPDQSTLDAVNDLRQKAGQQPLEKVGDFTKSDLKLVVDKLEETNTQRSNNVFKSTPEVLNGVRESGAFPKPAEPAAKTDPSMNMGG